MVLSTKKEFGDFQTPLDLANRVVSLVDKLFGAPELVIEPTAGLGSFLRASAETWKNQSEYIGYEINNEYANRSQINLKQYGVKIYQRDFFTENWKNNVSQSSKSRVLVIGNPPWVTNSYLGLLGSKNHPIKSNFLGLKGFDARTGKSNFDIAEWMLIQLIEALPSNGAIAMLCKTMTARKVLRHFWRTNEGREGTRLFRIDAKTEFDVSVDACLFFATGKQTDERKATVYSDLNIESISSSFGFIDGDLVSDIDTYKQYKRLNGGSSTYTWRSGIKHDAAKVMEFSFDGQKLINGFGDIVEIEEDYVYPLLKSSDLGNGRVAIRKAVLVTQRHTGIDTADIKQKAPKTWEYLMLHKNSLDGRKSSIYKNRPRFSVFGIGPYSFARWKIAISGLYKNISFMIVPPHNGRPVMVDDTCYSIPCHSEEEAEFLIEMLSSVELKAFLSALVFLDSKRPVTINVLRRISFTELACILGKLDKLNSFVDNNLASNRAATQMRLPLEQKIKYRISQSS